MKISLPRLPRFQLRSVFVLVACAAVGLAVVAAKLPDPEFVHLIWETTIDSQIQFALSGVLAAVVTWCAFGLAFQILDLRRALKKKGAIGRDERFTVQFGIVWRIVAVCTFAAFYSLGILVDQDIIQLPSSDGFNAFTDQTAREGLFYFMLLLTALSVATSKSSLLSRQQTGNRFLRWAGYVAATILIIVVCWQQTMIGYLVYVAIVGIELSEAFPLEGVDANLMRRNLGFLVVTSIAAVFVPANFLLLKRLANVRSKRRRETTTGLSVALAFGLAITLFYSIWVSTTGLNRLSPAMADALYVGSWHYWLTVSLILLAASAALARRLVIESREIESTYGPPAWNYGDYYHGSRSFSFLLVIVLGASAVCGLVGHYRIAAVVAGIPGPSESWLLKWAIMLETITADPTTWIAAAVFLVALRRSLLRRLNNLNPGVCAALPPGRFFTFWALSFLTIGCGALPTVWFIFALWLTPWYRLPVLDWDPWGSLLGG